jgi:hypothetical protein
MNYSELLLYLQAQVAVREIPMLWERLRNRLITECTDADVFHVELNGPWIILVCAEDPRKIKEYKEALQSIVAMKMQLEVRVAYSMLKHF